MFKKLYFLLITLTFLLLGIQTSAYNTLDTLRITDPYTCGADIVGKVNGGQAPVVVTVTLSQNGSIVKTFSSSTGEVNFNASTGDYFLATPDKLVAKGDYQITSRAVDNLGNTDSESYNATILPTADCPILSNIRTGATNFVRDNSILTAVVLGTSGVAAVYAMKNYRKPIER
jgi:hypothetical protein